MFCRSMEFRRMWDNWKDQKDLKLSFLEIFSTPDLLNFLSANPTKWPNTVKQFVGNLLTNCLSVFDHFVKLALKRLISLGGNHTNVLNHLVKNLFFLEFFFFFWKLQINFTQRIVSRYVVLPVCFLLFFSTFHDRCTVIEILLR